MRWPNTFMLCEIFILFLLYSCYNTTKFHSEILPDLISDDSLVREETITHIIESGDQAVAAAHELILLFEKEENGEIRTIIIEALGAIEPEMTQELNKTFVQALKDNNSHVRYAAVSVICEMEQIPANLIAKLPALLSDSDPYVREVTKSTFIRFGSLGIHPLMRTMAKADEKTRHLIAVILKHIGEEAKDASALLRQIQKEDESEVVRTAASEALEYIEP